MSDYDTFCNFLETIARVRCGHSVEFCRSVPYPYADEWQRVQCGHSMDRVIADYLKTLRRFTMRGRQIAEAN